MKEIELKFEAENDANEFIKTCDKLYVKIMPRTQETTTMYDNKEEFMLKSDSRLRMRTGYKNYLSYKKPITRRGIKEEIEFETEIKDDKQTALILGAIGYQPVSAYTRYRTIWEKNNVKIFLDEFSFGKFVEIEGDKIAIKKMANLLGFDLKNNITNSYDGIYEEYCRKNNIEIKKFFR